MFMHVFVHITYRGLPHLLLPDRRERIDWWSVVIKHKSQPSQDKRKNKKEELLEVNHKYDKHQKKIQG